MKEQNIKFIYKKCNRMVSALMLSMLLVFDLALTGCTFSESRNVTPEHVFVYAENQADDYPTTQAAYRFADLVSERTDGRIQIVVKSNGLLGDEKSIVAQMKFGGVDFSRVSLTTLADSIPELKVLMMPYLYSSEDAMWKVLDGEIGSALTSSISVTDNGIRALSWYDAGARNFYSVEPIKSLSDLKGLNIRVQESDVMSDLIELLGANAIQMTYSEVMQGLQTGVIDGAENNWASYELSNHYQSARYCLEDGHTRIPEVQIISDMAWSQLSEQDQIIISECATESALYERELWKQAEDTAKEEVQANGVIITQISEEEMAEFQEEVQPLYDKYCTDYMDIIEQIRSIR